MYERKDALGVFFCVLAVVAVLVVIYLVGSAVMENVFNPLLPGGEEWSKACREDGYRC